MGQKRTRNQRWTTAEISFIRENAKLGAEDLAAHFNSTTRAIRNLASREGISLVPEKTYEYELHCQDCNQTFTLLRLRRKQLPTRCDSCRNRAWRQATGYRAQASAEAKMLHSAKTRAKNKNLPFSLTISDIVIPDVCPVLGIKLERAVGKGNHMYNDASPTLDRIVPELGYVPENVAVISWRANKLKGDGSLDELEKIVSWLRAV